MASIVIHLIETSKLNKGKYKCRLGFQIIHLIAFFCFINTVFSQNITDSGFQTSNNIFLELAISYELDSNLDSTLYYYNKLIQGFNHSGENDSSIFYQNEITRVLIDNDSLEKAEENLCETKGFIDTKLSVENEDLAYWYFYSGKIKYKKEDYHVSLSYYDSSLNTFNKKINFDKELQANIFAHKGLSYMELSNYGEGIKFFKLSVGVFESNVDRYHQHLIKRYLNLGKMYSKLFKLDSSKIYIMKAFSLSRRFDDISYDEIQILYEQLAIHYLKSGMQDSALHYINKNINISKEITHNVFQEGQSYSLLGIIYKSKGEFFKAIYYYKKTIHRYDSALGYMHINSATSRENLGVAYMDLMDFDSSAKYLGDALTIRLKYLHEGDPAIGNSYLNLGSMSFYRSDFSSALNYYKKATSIYIAAYGDGHPYVRKGLGNIGSVLNNLGRNHEALTYFEKVRAIDSNNTSNLLNIGIAWARLQNLKLALHYMELCLEMRLENFPNPHPGIASAYLNIGMTYQENQEQSKALQYLFNATKIYSGYFGRKHNKVASCNLHIGEIYQIDTSYDKALEYYQKGLIAIAPGFESEDIYKNPDMLNQKILMDKTYIDLIKAKAEVFYKKYQLISHNKRELEESYKLYSYCIEQIPEFSRDYKNEATRLKLYDQYSGIYSNALSIHFELFGSEDINNAFSISEKGKSQLLYETIMESLAIAGANIDEDSKIKERQFRQKINLVEGNILAQLQNSDAFDSLEFSRLEGELFDLKLNYDRLKEMLRSNYSDYYELKYETSVASISDIQHNLSYDQALIEYALGDSILFAFVITKEKSSITKVLIDSTFTSLIEGYRNLNLKKQLDVADWENYLTKSFQLYSILLKPFEKQVKNKELIIIPDKEIGYIPFETLVTKSVSLNKTDYTDLPWLIKSHPISYAYSATLYINSRNKVADNNEMEVLAFAPFSKEQNTGYDQNTLSLLRERGIEDMELAGASNEVKAISGFYKTDIYFDSTATEKMFWEKSGNYNIIHIASHGIIDDENPSYSKLLFQNSPEDSLNDGKVHTFELFEKQLNAQLVVLSACNTGMGKIHKGEGVMSLARGFLYTGVPSIVMTLWSVDDQSSAELMKYFYKYLKAGDAKNIALQKAKISYLKKTKNPEKIHPRYWAGYVLIGDDSAITNRNPVGRFLVFAFILILLGLTWLIIQKKRRLR